MPRKQRFKPSRKPKPIPSNGDMTPQQHEDALIGRPTNPDGVHQNRGFAHDSPQPRDEAASSDTQAQPRSH